jgi:hypothetical protein
MRQEEQRATKRQRAAPSRRREQCASRCDAPSSQCRAAWNSIARGGAAASARRSRSDAGADRGPRRSQVVPGGSDGGRWPLLPFALANQKGRGARGALGAAVTDENSARRPAFDLACVRGALPRSRHREARNASMPPFFRIALAALARSFFSSAINTSGAVVCGSCSALQSIISSNSGIRSLPFEVAT